MASNASTASTTSTTSTASSGNVNHLDTKSFSDTYTAYANYVKQFEALVGEVNKICKNMVDNWKGKGRDAFEKDYKQVQVNLKDISDIMYDIRDALIDAHAEYIKADAALSKSFDS